ncbi:stage V sporulation protein AE [Desulforudis sp. 1088]|uniref:stage V sporulation protein AE n=1 Tax=unclassified Candidatus Desulforudis TaxID=2635950 RepID=UPI00346FD73F
MEWQTYIFAFLVGGAITMLGQLILDFTNFTPGHVLSGFVVAGGILSGLGLYEKLIEFAGAGATMPISSFGNALVQGAISEAERSGVIGVLTGMFELTSTGITAAIVFGFLIAVIFNPKG